ncbi:MAG TPA: ribulokinase [Planctomycetaceae bacterium]|jgi:L-ribulokinase|nr:ribulokinase [Planctomycetaceae bacterium]
MSPSSAVALGLDFGTESVRALLVDLEGNEHGSAVVDYAHGQITERLPGTGELLPPDFALQHPLDWIDSAAAAVRRALATGKIDPARVLSIGVDFTSCTMLPTLADGTPLSVDARWAAQKFAWPKLWKHHGAKSQTDRINAVARERRERWLDRYGGTIGLEWFFPKILETLENAPTVYDATAIWLEAGDWFVWQLVGGEAARLPRSTCQAGYKALWHSHGGFPSADFFRAVHPRLANVVAEKMPGRFLAPGQQAGRLTAAMAQRMGLPTGVPVSAAIIDAHAGVPGAGAAEPGTLVMVLGTSSCHMLNAVVERSVLGVAGIVEGGILPGYFGYETGQAAVGDAFDWFRRLVNEPNFDRLTRSARELPPGAEGVTCVDWLNGCRTPLMDGSLTGAFGGLTLNHTAGHLYRALMEASAFGLKWIVDLLRNSGVPVERFVATGGLPHHNPLLVQIYADVLGEPIGVHPSKHGPALGAAILGVLAAGPEAGGFANSSQAIAAMARPRATEGEQAVRIVSPNPDSTRMYAALYANYMQLAATYIGANAAKSAAEGVKAKLSDRLGPLGNGDRGILE